MPSFHEEFPPQLVALQDEHWKPLLDWVRTTFQVKVSIYEGILGNKQPDDTILKLGAVVEGYDQFQLAGPSSRLSERLRSRLTPLANQRLSVQCSRPSRT